MFFSFILLMYYSDVNVAMNNFASIFISQIMFKILHSRHGNFYTAVSIQPRNEVSLFSKLNFSQSSPLLYLTCSKSYMYYISSVSFLTCVKCNLYYIYISPVLYLTCVISHFYYISLVLNFTYIKSHMYYISPILYHLYYVAPEALFADQRMISKYFAVIFFFKNLVSFSRDYESL